MAILIAIVDVGPAMVVVVFASTLDAIVISLPLDIAKFLRWRVPVPVMIVILVLKCRSGCGKRLSHGEAGR